MDDAYDDAEAHPDEVRPGFCVPARVWMDDDTLSQRAGRQAVRGGKREGAGRIPRTDEQEKEVRRLRREQGGDWLRRKREVLCWSRPQLAAALTARGVAIGGAAVKRWEEGTATLRPEVRAAVEAIVAERSII